jgi:hypothetical protein
MKKVVPEQTSFTCDTCGELIDGGIIAIRLSKPFFVQWSKTTYPEDYAHHEEEHACSPECAVKIIKTIPWVGRGPKPAVSSQ